MKFNFVSAIFTAAVIGTAIESVSAAHLAACTKNMDGSGSYDQDSTEYCCGKVHGLQAASASYSKTYHDCRTGIVNGNSVDAGNMAKCCDDEGYGTTSQ